MQPHIMVNVLSDFVQKIVEHGFQNYFLLRTRRVLGIREKTIEKQNTEYDLITFSKLEYCFIIYLMGMIMGFIVFLLEILYKIVDSYYISQIKKVFLQLSHYKN